MINVGSGTDVESGEIFSLSKNRIKFSHEVDTARAMCKHAPSSDKKWGECLGMHMPAKSATPCESRRF